MMSKFFFPGFAAVFVLASGTAFGDVRLPRIFGDHMVLQRDQGIPVWGWADPGEKVTVSVGKQSASTTSGADGKWSVRLGNLAASSEPVKVIVEGKNTLVFKDVLVGDVWVCSGQSNMEFRINFEASAREELPKANLPMLRLFRVPRVTAPRPMDDTAAPDGVIGAWQVCTSETLAALKFSAVGYYFGKNILENTRQPVGMIGTFWGGTAAQAWTPLEDLQATPTYEGYVREAREYANHYQALVEAYPGVLKKYEAELAEWRALNGNAEKADELALKTWENEVETAIMEGRPIPPKPPRSVVAPQAPKAPEASHRVPTALYNGMVAPVIPFGIKGVVWYQGESNASRPEEYRNLFPAMITAWRKHWGQGDFPFIFAQVANLMRSNWPLLREAQSKALSLPNTAMAVTIDIGEGHDIHPKDKWDVGMRLSLAARHVAYGEKLVFCGPVYKAIKVESPNVRVEFDHTGGGLVIGSAPEHFHPGAPRKTVSELQGFTIAGADGKFVEARARIDRDNTVIVSSDEVPSPVTVRYAWADNPAANLYNKEGLPAAPFRSDSN